MWTAVANHISDVTGEPFRVQSRRSVGGGSINRAFVIEDAHRRYFVKLNDHTRLDMFEAEALGLQALRAADTIRVPEPICWAVNGEHAYLVLEWLDLVPTGNWEHLGENLANLHRVTSAQGFGWVRDNTIGSTPQPNPRTADWAEFFTRHRLAYQLALPVAQATFERPVVEKLLNAANALLDGHRLEPALLHGDLWSGNAGFTATGEPVIFDPAVYYGDRETDLAMTELFGGFPPAFYAGYQRRYPLDPRYQKRKTLYSLYHILNHLNLFGRSYASQANSVIHRLLNTL